MKKRIFLLLAVISVAGCSAFDRIFPDNSGEYRRAETLPNLEVPPDLTAGAINQGMAVPGEVSMLAQTTASGPSIWAEIRSIDQNRSLLSIPAEFAVAWGDIERALEGGNIVVNDKNLDTDTVKGTINVTYTPDQETGWFSRMAFWRSSGQAYTLSLTGEGNLTELVVLDRNGEWATSTEAERLLATIRTQYNQAKRQ